MAFIFANNVNTVLAAPVTSGATTITLSSSANLPASVPSGYYFVITLNDAATRQNFEIVYATAITGTTLTVIRAQEGTAALSWSTGDFAFNGVTAGQMISGAKNIAVYKIISGSQQVSINGAAFTTTGATSFTSVPVPVKVRVWGGGGGSGGTLNTGAMSGAGGGAEYAEGIFTISSTQTVTVGAPGAAGSSAGPTNGGVGGTTSFGSLITAVGGNGGGAQNGAGAQSSGTGGTGGTGGTLRLPGTSGSIGFNLPGSALYAAIGGASFYCGMNQPLTGTVAAAGIPGVFPGQGATGSIDGSNGATGASGYVIVEW